MSRAAGHSNAAREEGAAGSQADGEVELLYRSRASSLASALRRSAGNREAAWDAVQESFARFAALAPDRRNGIAKPEAYLRRTALNLLRDWGRAAVRAAVVREQAEQAAEPAPDPVRALESRDTLRRLEAAMLRLRPKTREIFLAHRLDGLSYAEIAERTGLSVKGVEKQMSKAIAMIDRLAGDR